MEKFGYDEILWRRIEKISFFYPLSQVLKTNSNFKKLVLILWILIIIWIIFIIYSLANMEILTENKFSVLILAIWIVIILLCPIALIFALLEKWRFDAGIYDMGINIQWRSRLYTEFIELKIFKYPENWNEYIKLIYKEYDEKILIENVLYNVKMEPFLDKLQEDLMDRGIKCERINDIKDIDIAKEVEFRTNFRFFSVWNLLSLREKIKRIKNIMFFMLLYIFFWGLMFVSSLLWDENTSLSEAVEQFPENFYSWLRVFIIILIVLMLFLFIHFVLSIKKFYARIENNAVYIHNWYGWKWSFLSDNYVLSNIKVNYSFIVEWDIEWIMLTVEKWNQISVYKRPRNEKTEQFCSKLSDEVRKHKKI